jgi:hypothetical protein
MTLSQNTLDFSEKRQRDNASQTAAVQGEDALRTAVAEKMFVASPHFVRHV